jgi:thiamine-monophosphate kinase
MRKSIPNDDSKRASGNSTPPKPPGELSLLRTIRERSAALTGSQLRLGIGDDCALLRPKASQELAITTDLSIEGRHFRLDWHPPESVGHRTLARGLSDLAAMGARPVAAFLSLGLPRELTYADPGKAAWVERFLDGLLALAAEYKVPLAGGDLAESPIAVADIVLTGAVRKDKAMLRSGAKPGEILYVTGKLGGAAAELAALSNAPQDFTEFTSARTGSPHLYPQPRVAQGLWLRKHQLASAAMDLSDGLSTDLAHLCEESGVAAEVDASLIPIAEGSSLELALHGGEDYELLFAAPASARLPNKIDGISITAIGIVKKARRGQPRVTLHKGKLNHSLLPQGWEHFST